MYVQEVSPNVFTQVGATIVEKRNGNRDNIWPSSIIGIWTAQQLADIGVYPVTAFTPPAGFQTTGVPRYERQGDAVVELYDVLPIRVTEITRRQLILGLYRLGLINADEAQAAATVGALPQMVADFFDQIPDEQTRVEARVTWASMSVCERNNPYLAALQQINGLTDEQVDQYFAEFSQL